MPVIAEQSEVVQLRYNFYDVIDLFRPDVQGTKHVGKERKDFHAAFDVSFCSGLDLENFYASAEFAKAI